MIRPTKLSNINRRRTLRVLYGPTQAYPYAATLSSNFDRSGGVLALANHVGKAAIFPGMVAVRLVGEVVTLAGSTEGSATNLVTTPSLHPFGLFANHVGGELSDIDTNQSEVGVWRGKGSVYQVLAPAFDDTGLAAAAAAEDGAALANEVNMVPGTDGRLVFDNAAVNYETADHVPAARLISRLSDKAIIIEALV